MYQERPGYDLYDPGGPPNPLTYGLRKIRVFALLTATLPGPGSATIVATAVSAHPLMGLSSSLL
jgi:hypothetical protein